MGNRKGYRGQKWPQRTQRGLGDRRGRDLEGIQRTGGMGGDTGTWMAKQFRTQGDG